MTDNRISLRDGETLDAGSFKLKEVSGDVYTFYGLHMDVPKLPKVQSIGTGSIAYCVDDGTLLMYESTTQEWYEQ